jgi:hypothetical protein
MATAVQLRLPGLSRELMRSYLIHEVKEIVANYQSVPKSWGISLDTFILEWCDSGCAQEFSDKHKPMYFAHDHFNRPTNHEPSRDPCCKVWYVPKGTGTYAQRLEQAMRT